MHLLRQVCHSLAEAHAEGLIHRDIKPANVYVCRYGRELDFVKVLDFGLVKSKRETECGDVTLTRAEGTIGGTPAFMSPEQVLGDRPVDGRSDIYAVGCLAYWLVTGQLVFTGRTVMDTLLQQTQASPVPPSRRTELEISPVFDRLVLSCLAKNPEDRPATADAFADRLGEVLTTASWTTKDMREWWETHHPGSRVNGQAE
jgi:serine/threonine-protein kinase